MKPFNLEEYLKNPSRKVITRAGSKARIICTNANSEHPIIALVEICDYEEALTYTKDGCYFSIGPQTHLDLSFAPEKHEGWGVICGSFLARAIFTAKEEAEEFVKRMQSKDFVAIAKIEWEE